VHVPAHGVTWFVTEPPNGDGIMISAAVPHLGGIVLQLPASIAAQVFFAPSEASVQAKKLLLSRNCSPQINDTCWEVTVDCEFAAMGPPQMNIGVLVLPCTNVPKRANDVRTEPVLFSITKVIVVFIVCPGVHVKQAPTPVRLALTTAKSLEVQRLASGQSNCADAVLERIKVKNKKTVVRPLIDKAKDFQFLPRKNRESSLVKFRINVCFKK
jgi:hypothetical protein